VLKHTLSKVIPLFVRLEFIADFGLRIADCLRRASWEKQIRNPQSEIRNKESRFGTTT
jgi:hypothetical protein